MELSGKLTQHQFYQILSQIWREALSRRFQRGRGFAIGSD